MINLCIVLYILLSVAFHLSQFISTNCYVMSSECMYRMDYHSYLILSSFLKLELKKVFFPKKDSVRIAVEKVSPHRLLKHMNLFSKTGQKMKKSLSIQQTSFDRPSNSETVLVLAQLPFEVKGNDAFFLFHQIF